MQHTHTRQHRPDLRTAESGHLSEAAAYHPAYTHHHHHHHCDHNKKRNDYHHEDGR